MAHSPTSTKQVLLIPHFTSVLQGVPAENGAYPPKGILNRHLPHPLRLLCSSSGATVAVKRTQVSEEPDAGPLRAAERDDHVGDSGGENVVARPETVGNPFGAQAGL